MEGFVFPKNTCKHREKGICPDCWEMQRIRMVAVRAERKARVQNIINANHEAFKDWGMF